ncbi:TIR-like protein FxsC [Frankia tisae]|uniref:TIR-like protein FxsC n=1 Tax=Frankia tisae TaxID=2950104 RepID=UPI0021C05EE6|nr:TIR-like protein FxsC [Frankia tisae]
MYFFLSYARIDIADGPFLDTFLLDLRREVRTRCGHPSLEDVGFLDTSSIRPGEAWSDELADALRQCRTFVAICSRSFFASEYCGREWQVFDDRLRARTATGLARPPALLPVIWTPLRPAPTILSRLQYNHRDLGEVYARHGLRYLLQLKRNYDEYQEFLVALANRIISLAEESPLLPMTAPPDFHAVRNAFEPAGGAAQPSPFAVPAAELELRTDEHHRVIAQNFHRSEHSVSRPEDRTAPRPAPEWPASPERGPEPASAREPDPSRAEERDLPAPADYGAVSPSPPGSAGARSRPDPGDAVGEVAPVVREALVEAGGGPKRVTFVLAVTSASELAALRRQLDYYGGQFDEWIPFHPHFPQRVCILAQAVAASQEMSSTIVKLHPGISELLEASRERNEVVIFIVDAWTAMLEPFHSALVEYDRRNEPTTGVLVPWNPHDVETIENAAKLTASLRQTLRNNAVRQDNMFRMEVHSHDDFGKILIQVLTESQARIFSSQPSLRSRDTRPRRRPFLQGP